MVAIVNIVANDCGGLKYEMDWLVLSVHFWQWSEMTRTTAMQLQPVKPCIFYIQVDHQNFKKT